MTRCPFTPKQLKAARHAAEKQAALGIELPWSTVHGFYAQRRASFKANTPNALWWQGECLVMLGTADPCGEFSVEVELGDIWVPFPQTVSRAIAELKIDRQQLLTDVRNDIKALKQWIAGNPPSRPQWSVTCSESSERLCRRLGLEVNASIHVACFS